MRALGFGCMRLSTEPNDADHAVSVIHAALDAGAVLLDTADVYSPDEKQIGHNEALVARALTTWKGDRSRVRIATKGGLRRTGGRWLPDGRATHLRAACTASLRALQTDCIDLYQLHAVDPKTSLDTSVRALAALQESGQVRAVGLCNVNVAQIEAARRITAIAAVQVSLGVFDDENLRNGVAEYCRDTGIELLAYRPLGGERAARLSRDPVLQAIAAQHESTAQEIALSWLLDLAPHLVPLPGATQIAHAEALARVLSLVLTDEDRTQLDTRFPAGRLLRMPRAQRRPPDTAPGAVVLVMGMPGAGKSTVAQEFTARGYERLNRDELGGRLSDLVASLEIGLEQGKREWVLDNTYASRAARNEVIECAWQHGVPVRCVQLTTSVPDAQINAVNRLLELQGTLPSPEELRAKGKTDARYFGPDAQFRYERQVEPPSLDEGFVSIEERAFERRPNPRLTRRAVLFEYDGVLCTSASGQEVALVPDDVLVPPGRAALLQRYRQEEWLMLAIAWRPQLTARSITMYEVQACFTRTRELLGVDIQFAFCPHPAGPPVCWCRKPLPGLPLEFAHHHDVALGQSILVGRAPLDRTLAERLGLQYQDYADFFREDY
jgi:aryl-alcohol dehydrogenase-like predicted oxidoreductase